MLKGIRIWHKLTFIALLLTVPVGTLGFLFVRNAQGQIDTTRQELAAIEYFKPLRQLLELIPQHGALVQVEIGGETSLEARRKEIEAEIGKQVQAMDAADQKWSRQFSAGAEWSRTRAQWVDLQKNGLSMSGDTSAERHRKLTNDIQQMMATAGERAALTTDFEVDSHYLAEALVSRISQVTGYLAQLRLYGAGVALRGRISQEDQLQMSYLARELRNSSEQVNRDLRAAIRYNASLESKLSATIATATDLTLNFTDKLSTQNSGLTAVPESAASFYHASTDLGDRYFRLYDVTADALAGLLNRRAERLSDQLYTQLLLAGLVLLTATVSVFLVSRGITWQIRSITNTFAEVEAGNYDARCDVRGKDELARLAVSLNATFDSTLTLIQSRQERDRIQHSVMKLLDEVSGVAAGDLRKEAEVTGDITGAIADSFNYMIAELRQIISSVQQTTSHVTQSARQAQLTTDELARGSEQQSHQILAASEAIQQMAQQVQQVSVAASSASSVASEAVASARQGAASVAKTIEGMTAIRARVQETSKRIKRLGESSQEIGEIVQLISDIADRTSILALNTSIQAAMAGEAGRGFAVVAEEVERMAERATESTQRIAALIKSVQSDTGQAIAAMEETTHEVVSGSQLANEAGQRLAQIEQVSRQISELVESISRAAQKQAEGSVAVSHNVTGISAVTRQAAEGAGLVADSIRRLASLTQQLNDSVSRFKLPEGQQVAV